ncbi:hypothetical protein F5887DRAFT_1080942 [Amanita rubescens]|nr:hypothetical protein F5887DRAFT_1080942 [Amanita rubescens]
MHLNLAIATILGGCTLTFSRQPQDVAIANPAAAEGIIQWTTELTLGHAYVGSHTIATSSLSRLRPSQTERLPPSSLVALLGPVLWDPSRSTVNEVNRQRTEAMTSQPAPQIPLPSSTLIEDYICAVWPFVLDKSYSYKGHLPPKPVFTVRLFEETVEHLFKNELAFRLKIGQHRSELWKIIDRSLHEHLTNHGFQITRRDGDNGNSFNKLSWDVLGQSKKTRDRLDFKSGLVGLAGFTLEFLSREAINVPLYEGGPKVPCLFLAPTHGNIRGPITDGPVSHLHHACMPWRLLARFKTLFKTDKVGGDECIAGQCPTAEEEPVPTPSNTVCRARSPLSPPHNRNVRQRRDSRNSPASDEDSDMEDLPLPPSPATRRRLNPRQRPIPWVSPSDDDESSDSDVEVVVLPRDDDRPQAHDMDVDSVISIVGQDLFEEEPPALPNLLAALNHVDDVKLLRLEKLDEWQRRIRRQNNGIDYSINAPSSNAAAIALIDILSQLSDGIQPRDLVLPGAPIECEFTSCKALLSPIRPFFVGNGKEFHQIALGDGPAHSVLQVALDIRLESTPRWLPFLGDAYRTLNFGRDSTLLRGSQVTDFRVDGSLTALVMIQLLQEPYPINPFLVYAAFFPDEKCLDFLAKPYGEYKPEHLLAMIPDKETQALVAAIFAHRPDETHTPIQVARHPLLSRAVVTPNAQIDIAMFAEPRQPDEHTTIIRLLLSDVLIGHAHAWKQLQFKAFAGGLRLGICSIDHIVKPRTDGEDQNDIYLYAFKLVSTLWNNRIESYFDVFNRISISCVYKPADAEIAEIYARLFLLRLFRWIKGQGHPPELVGSIVSEEKSSESESSPPTMRAKLFWKAMTDTVSLPATKAGKDVTIRLKYMPSLQPSRHRPCLHISVCAKQMDVTLEPDLMNLLLEPGSMTNGADTAFDLWIHSLLATADNNYNNL